MKIRFLVLLNILLITLSAYSLDSEKPLWLLIDDGEAAVESGELGKAAYLFREILKKDRSNPEAMKWLGYIFEKEGEFSIAIKQYEKALENSKNLNVTEDWYYIMYHLSGLYRQTGNESEYIEALKSIINETPSEKIDTDQLNAMVNLLEKKGMDTFFELYRPASRITLEAHRLLGEYYNTSGKFNDALGELIYAFGTPVTFAIGELKKIDPNYRFSAQNGKSNFERFLQTMLKNSRLKSYFKDVKFFNTLLTAGMSLYQAGFKERGVETITLVYDYALDIVTRNKAARFYANMP